MNIAGNTAIAADSDDAFTTAAIAAIEREKGIAAETDQAFTAAATAFAQAKRGYRELRGPYAVAIRYAVIAAKWVLGPGAGAMAAAWTADSGAYSGLGEMLNSALRVLGAG